jgi:hypothetical protein
MPTLKADQYGNTAADYAYGAAYDRVCGEQNRMAAVAEMHNTDPLFHPEREMTTYLVARRNHDRICDEAHAAGLAARTAHLTH